MVKLINATPSPWGRKVRILLIEKGLDVEVVNDIPWAPDTCVPQYNPLEKLPILIADDGESVYESRLIVEWVERYFPEPAMIPSDNAGYLACKKAEVLADGIMDAGLLFFMEGHRESQDAAWSARQGRKLVGGVAEVARMIGTRPFAVGDRFTLADAAIGAMLGSLEFIPTMTDRVDQEVQWRQQHPNLGDYFDRLEERPSFAATRPVMFDFDVAQSMQHESVDG